MSQSCFAVKLQKCLWTKKLHQIFHQPGGEEITNFHFGVNCSINSKCAELLVHQIKLSINSQEIINSFFFYICNYSPSKNTKTLTNCPNVLISSDSSLTKARNGWELIFPCCQNKCWGVWNTQLIRVEIQTGHQWAVGDAQLHFSGQKVTDPHLLSQKC